MIPMITRARLGCEVGDVPEGVVRELVATAMGSELAGGTAD